MMQVFQNGEALSQGAADAFSRLAQEAIAAHGQFSVALSGGKTPKRMFEILAQPPFQNSIDWQNIFLFWGDERCVSQDDENSNFRMTRLALLDHIDIPPKNLYPMPGTVSPQDGAAAYEATLRQFFGDQSPAFDLIFLGLGENGHTASLFPHTAALQETTHWVTDVYVAESNMHRLTLTAPVINQGKTVIFLAEGDGKADVLHQVLEGPQNTDELPAQLIHPTSGQLIWMVDEAAAAKMTSQAVS